MALSWRETNNVTHLAGIVQEISSEATMYSAYAFQLPVCGICTKSIPLETSKTDERGHAIHEGCYLLRLRLLDATSTRK
jgi:hypothetical protein